MVYDKANDKIFDIVTTIILIFFIGCYFLSHPECQIIQFYCQDRKDPTKQRYAPQKAAKFLGFGCWGIGLVCIPCVVAVAVHCPWISLLTIPLLAILIAVCWFIELHGYLK